MLDLINRLSAELATAAFVGGLFAFGVTLLIIVWARSIPAKTMIRFMLGTLTVTGLGFAGRTYNDVANKLLLDAEIGANAYGQLLGWSSSMPTLRPIAAQANEDGVVTLREFRQIEEVLGAHALAAPKTQLANLLGSTRTAPKPTKSGRTEVDTNTYDRARLYAADSETVVTELRRAIADGTLSPDEWAPIENAFEKERHERARTRLRNRLRELAEPKSVRPRRRR